MTTPKPRDRSLLATFYHEDLTMSLQQADLILEDQLTEIRTILDPVWGPAEAWPESDDVDGWRWELGPALPPDDEPLPVELAPVEVDPADVEWLNTQPSLDDLLEYEAWSRWVEMKDRERMITEEDIRNAGLPI
jgi:hypothetical protein